MNTSRLCSVGRLAPASLLLALLLPTLALSQTFTAGTCDDYVFPTEPAYVSPAVTALYPSTVFKNFDDLTTNRGFSHTFTGLPTNICACTLTFVAKTTSGDNDGVALSLNGGAWAWGQYLEHIPAPLSGWSGTARTFVLDCAALPKSLPGTPLPTANITSVVRGTLEWYIQDDTAVDCASLTVTACAPCGDGDVDPGEQCDDGNVADGDCCSSTCQFDGDGSACTTDGDVCTDDVCDGAGVCTHPFGTASCEDGDLCTAGDTCSAGTCVSGPFDPAACVDHYLCYKSAPTKGQPRFAAIASLPLAEEFGSGPVAVSKAKALCPPADKNDEGIHDDVTHLEAYEIKPIAPLASQVGVVIQDQFGTLTIDTTKADRLLVPTNKGLTVQPPAPAVGMFDHYQCHRLKLNPASLPFTKLQVTVADQFEDRTYDVKKPRHLCNPVDKNGEGIVEPDVRLMCYQVKAAKGQAKHTRVVGQIYTANQFGQERLDTVKEEELCVPARRLP